MAYLLTFYYIILTNRTGISCKCQNDNMSIKIKQILNDSNDINDMEFMPLVPMGDLEINDSEKKELPVTIPIIALRNTILFPNVVLPITVSREKSAEAIKFAAANNNYIGVLSQMDATSDDPNIDSLYRIGTLAKIIKQIKMPDGTTTILIMGRMRFNVTAFIEEKNYLEASVTYLEDKFPKKDKEFEAMIATMKDLSEKLIDLSANMQLEANFMLKNIENNSFLMHYIATNLDAKVSDKQLILEESNIKERASKIISHLSHDVEFAQLKNEIANKTKGEIDKQQREYFLQQQLKSITDELGHDQGNEKEIQELEKRSKTKKWNENVQEVFTKNIARLRRMHPQAPEYATVYNYVELLLDLPWNEYTEDKYDLKKALKVLDKEHYGMEIIKDRILEYLAVLKLKGDLKSPILCFVGPPGIGKTSLGASIANAISRKYIRLSLGGLHDESELRGHRKTYIGAMPGRIIQSIRKAKTANPVIVLDEIEKIGKDFRGDPSSALLEILDPEQNSTFYDNYLEQEFDLSKVLFIATANSINDIQPALRDRLEIIHLSGYSIEEKLEIAKKHLVPKQIAAHGLETYKLKFTPSILQFITDGYTRESGVRNLNRKIASVIRYIAKLIVMEEEFPKTIDQALVEKALGKAIFNISESAAEKPAGVATGLAWTSVGGEILFIEALTSKGKGNLQLTGNLGNVMKESAITALSYIKAHAEAFQIEPSILEETNVHIHVPEGATPKDGPSAGITMLSALVSAYTGRKVKPYIAMSGEITLRGDVLPVGGIKEKVLAAKRNGMKEIILCEKNEKDIDEIPKTYLKGLKFKYVKHMDEVIQHALFKK